MKKLATIACWLLFVMGCNTVQPYPNMENADTAYLPERLLTNKDVVCTDAPEMTGNEPYIKCFKTTEEMNRHVRAVNRVLNEN